MLTRRPIASVLAAAFLLQKAGIGWSSPGLKQIPGLVEPQHGGRRYAARGMLAVCSGVSKRADGIPLRVFPDGVECASLSGTERSRPVVHPDGVLAIDEQTSDLSEPPVVRQRLGPARIDDEAWGHGRGGHVWRCPF